jgi:homocysteine S-methyltransferase
MMTSAPAADARARFRARLAAGPILADGGMGTLLFARGIPQRACLDELPTTRPDLIAAIHREFIEAGADIIETVSFGANRLRLGGYDLGSRAHAFNRRAAQVAREARDVVGRDVLVAGSIGPLGAPTRELATHDEAILRAALREQVEGLLEGGVDLFVIETYWNLEHLLAAIDEARQASDLPIVADMTFGEEQTTVDGTTPEVAAAAPVRAGVEVIGVNCGAGPRACLEALVRMGPASDGAASGQPRRSIMPNAGLPQRIEGQFVYAAPPAYFGEMIPRMLAAGAHIVGGCCGTTPEHIAAMRGALDRHLAAAAQGAPLTPREAADRAADRRPVALPSGAEAAPGARVAAGAPLSVDEELPPTGLAAALAARRFVVSVEIDPPRSVRIERTIEAARLLGAAGVDLVNVSDSAMARVRMSGLAVAFSIQAGLGLECLVHITTRDRNLMALESELLGAHALGVRNILALTGDPVRIGDYPTGSGVWDVDSIGLVEILARLNRGEDAGGSPIGQRARFTIACALDPTAADGETEWDRLERKLAAGAQLVMTQPLYSVGQVEAMLAEARRRFGPGGFPVPVLLGILPLQSGRHAEFLHNEVPGITIPDAVRGVMSAARDRGAEVGLELSLDLLGQVRSEVAGTYLMPSFGRYEQAAELVRRIRVIEGGAVRAPAGQRRSRSTPS